METRFGQRWFHIWQNHLESKLVVVKQAAPDTPAVVCCELSAGLCGVRVAFSLLSGRVLGTAAFNAISAEDPLLVNDLRTAASEQALKHGLLETHRQAVGLAFPGFRQDLPDGLLLWSSNAVTETELQAWLTYLQPLSPTELARWDRAGEDNSSSSEATSGLDGSPGSFWLEEPASDVSEVQESN